MKYYKYVWYRNGTQNIENWKAEILGFPTPYRMYSSEA